MAGPYDPPKAQVMDPERGVVARPRFVTIALVVLWAMVAIWALGVVRQAMHFGFAGPMMSGAYLTFVIGMTLVPAFLRAVIALAITADQFCQG